jgi:hypothetical protein
MVVIVNLRQSGQILLADGHNPIGCFFLDLSAVTG